jgi:hypothetical protein
MRVSIALLVVLLIGGVAVAEKAKAREAAKVYSRAGEQGKVVVKIKEGQVMRIDRKEGRWFKVRVAGRTGWIPRAKVSIIEEDEIARNTRRRPFVDGRGTKRGFGGGTGPEDRVGADAVDPDKGGGDGGGDEGGDDGGDDEPTTKKPTTKKPTTKKPTTKPDPDEDGDTDGEEPSSSDDTEEADDRPRVRVAAKATIYSEADEDSEEAEWSVKPDMILFPTGKKGKFTEVENEEGDIGFILTAKVAAVESKGGGGDDRGDGKPSKPGKIDINGRLGVTILQQGMRSDGAQMLPDNYNLSTSAATIAAGGSYLRPYGKKYVIGGELAIDIAKAVPGVKALMGQTTAITLYHINLRGEFGLATKRKSGLMLLGRLGFRFQSYQVGNNTDLTKNTARLPSEILKAPTLGGAVAIPNLTKKIGLRFSLDAVLIGASLAQTKNLEDGNKAGMRGAVLGAGFTYRWKPKLDIHATYDFNYSRYNFGTPIAGSMRGHMGTGEVKRTDTFHGVAVGVATGF